MPARPGHRGIAARSAGDVVLLGVTVVELALLFVLVPTFEIADWIYVSQHLLVLGIALTRQRPSAQDQSLGSAVAVVVAYTYPYAQVACLRFIPGEPASPRAGIVLVTAAAGLSLVSLLALGRRFGIRPALRSLATKGPYRLVRHPIYLAYVLADIGYNLNEWNLGTVVLVMAGWAATIYRIHAEERILARDPGWRDYVATVRFRLIPGVW